MTPQSQPAKPYPETGDCILDLIGAMIVLAWRDYQRGPGTDWRQRRRYASAKTFLENSGLLERIEQHDQQAPAPDGPATGATQAGSEPTHSLPATFSRCGEGDVALPTARTREGEG